MTNFRKERMIPYEKQSVALKRHLAADAALTANGKKLVSLKKQKASKERIERQERRVAERLKRFVCSLAGYR